MTVTRVDSSAGSRQLAFDLDSITPPRPELRELWTPEDILAVAIKEGADSLLRFREDNRVEWKSGRYSLKELADYFSMWANTQPHGGLIVIGVENDGTVSGCLGVGPDKISEFEQVGPAQCPDARFDIRRIGAQRVDGSPDFLLLIRVYYRPDKLVETVRSEAFVRSGKTKRQLSEDEKREIRINKGQIEYEKEAVSLRYPQDFDELLIRDFCDQYKAKRGLSTGHTREQILCLNHLGTMQDGKFGPNLAGALLFAVDPRQVVPGARIRFMKFEGTEEKTGQEYSLRERCVHRSYNLRNMNIFVKMFDDRLVVESPGGFPPPVTPENIYDTHNPRNPHLMNALFYLDYVKCAHEGTRRMRDMMIGANLPEPEFTQQEIGTHQVHVTLRNNIEARKEFVEAGALKLIGEGVYEQLNQEEKQVINFIAEKARINVSDANRLLQKDWQTAKRTLDDLAARGILMRRSRTNKPRDPSAHYVLRRRSS